MPQTSIAPGAALRVNGQGNPILTLQHDAFYAEVSLDGGQLITYQAKGQRTLLFLSPLAQSMPGNAIRGGVPICWPWFGPHPTDPTQPQHGIARTALWILTDITRTPDNFSIELQGPDYQNLKVESCLQLGFSHVTMMLTTHNHGDTPQHYSAALHTYLAVSHVNHSFIQGVKDRRYYDKVLQKTEIFHDDIIYFHGEMDRIVYGLSNTTTLVDETWRRKIVVENTGSASMVLWNPGEEKAFSLKDLPNDAWKDFICIEAANAEEDARVIEPGESHTLGTHLMTIPL